MNLRDIAKKFGSYISSKTQDDEGFFRQGKFTPVKQTQQIAQNVGQTKPSNQLVNKAVQFQPVQNFCTGLKSLRFNTWANTW